MLPSVDADPVAPMGGAVGGSAGGSTGGARSGTNLNAPAWSPPNATTTEGGVPRVGGTPSFTPNMKATAWSPSAGAEFPSDDVLAVQSSASHTTGINGGANSNSDYYARSVGGRGGFSRGGGAGRGAGAGVGGAGYPVGRGGAVSGWREKGQANYIRSGVSYYNTQTQQSTAAPPTPGMKLGQQQRTPVGGGALPGGHHTAHTAEYSSAGDTPTKAGGGGSGENLPLGVGGGEGAPASGGRGLGSTFFAGQLVHSNIPEPLPEPAEYRPYVAPPPPTTPPPPRPAAVESVVVNSVESVLMDDEEGGGGGEAPIGLPTVDSSEPTRPGQPLLAVDGDAPDQQQHQQPSTNDDDDEGITARDIAATLADATGSSPATTGTPTSAAAAKGLDPTVKEFAPFSVTSSNDTPTTTLPGNHNNNHDESNMVGGGGAGGTRSVAPPVSISDTYNKTVVPLNVGVGHEYGVPPPKMLTDEEFEETAATEEGGLGGGQKPFPLLKPYGGPRGPSPAPNGFVLGETLIFSAPPDPFNEPFTVRICDLPMKVINELKNRYIARRMRVDDPGVRVAADPLLPNTYSLDRNKGVMKLPLHQMCVSTAQGARVFIGQCPAQAQTMGMNAVPGPHGRPAFRTDHDLTCKVFLCVLYWIEFEMPLNYGHQHYTTMGDLLFQGLCTCRPWVQEYDRHWMISTFNHRIAISKTAERELQIWPKKPDFLTIKERFLLLTFEIQHGRMERENARRKANVEYQPLRYGAHGNGEGGEYEEGQEEGENDQQSSQGAPRPAFTGHAASAPAAFGERPAAAPPSAVGGSVAPGTSTSSAANLVQGAPKVNHELSMKKAKENAMSKIQLATQRLMLSVGLTIPGFSAVVADLKAHYVAKASTSAHWSPAEANSTRTLIDKYGGVMEIVLDELLPPDNVSTNYPGQATQDTLLATLKYRTGYVLAPLLDFSALEHGSLHTNNYSPQCVLQHLRQEDPSSTAADIHGNSSAAFVLQRLEIPEAAVARQQAQEEAKKIQQQKSQPVLLQAVGEEDDGVVIGGGTLPARLPGGPKPRKRGNYHLLLKGPRVPLNRTSTLENPLESRRLLFHIGWQLVKEYHHFGKCHGSVSLESVVMLYPPGACDANRAAAGLDPELCTYRLTPPIQNNPIGTPVSNKPGGGAAGGQPLGPGAASWSGTKATPAQIQQDVQDYCVLVLQVLYPDQLLLGSQSSSSAAKSNTTRKSKENFFGPSASCGAIEEEAASHVSFFERLSALSGDLEGIVRQVQDFKRREEQELREATQGAHGPPPSLSMLYEGYSQQAAMATLALHQFCESLDVNTAIQQVNAVSASATMRPGVRNTLPPHPANVASYQIKQQHQIQAASGGGSVAILLDHFLEMFIRVQWTSTVQKGGPQRKQLKVSLPKDLWAAADQSAKDAAEKAKQEKSNLWDSAKVIPVLAAPKDETATTAAAENAAVQSGSGTKSVQDYSVTVVGPFSPKMRVSGATQQQQDHKVGAIPSDIVVRTLSGFSVEEHKSEVAFQQFLSAARSSAAAAAGGAPPGESTLEQVLVVGKTLQLIIGTVGAGAADVTGTGPADAGIRTVSCVEFLKSQVPPVQGQHPLPEAVSTLARQLLTILNDQYMYQQQASPSSSSASAETLLKLRIPQLCVNPEAAAEAPTAATGGRPQCLIAAYPPTLDAPESAAEGLHAGETVAVPQQAGNSAPKHQSTKPAAVSEGGVGEITAADVVKKGTPAFLGDLLLFLGRTVGGWIMALLPSEAENEGEEGEDEKKKKKILNPHTMAPMVMLRELKKRLHIENDEDGDAPLHCPLSFEFVELVFRYAVVVLASDVDSLGDNQYCLETLVAHEFLSPPLGGAAAVSVTPPSLSAVLGKNADLLHLYTAGVGDENDSSSSISQGPRDLLSYFHPSHPARALVVQFLTRRLIFQNEYSGSSGSLKDVVDRLCQEAEELERHTQQTTRRNAGGDDTDAPHSDADDDDEEEEEIVLAKPHRGGGTKRTEMELRHDLTQVVIHILTCVWRWSTGEAHSAGPMPSSSSPTSSSLSNVGSSYRDDDGGEEDWALYFPVHEVSTWSPLLADFVSHCLDVLTSLANPCITLKETLSVKVQGGVATSPPLHQTTTVAEAVHLAEENKKNMKKQEGRSSFSFFGLLGHEFLNQPPAVTEFISNIDFASPPISGVPHAVQQQATAVTGHSLTVEEIYFLLAAYCSTKTSVAENATSEDLSALPSLVLQNMLVAYQNHSAQMVKLAEQQHRLQPFLPTPHVSLPPLISQFAKLASLEVIKSITPGNNTAAADQITPQISSWMQSRYGTSLELFFKGATEDPSGSPFLDALHRGPWDAHAGAPSNNATSSNAFIMEVTKCLEPPQPVPAPAPVVAPAPTATGQQHHMFEHQNQQHHHYQQHQQQPGAVKSTPIVAPAPRSHQQQQQHQPSPVAPGHHHQQHDPHVVMTRSAQLSAATAELQHQFQHEQQHPPLMMQFAPPISDRQRITGLLAATNQTQPQQQQQHAPLLPPAGVPAQSSPPAPWDFDTQE